MTVETKRPSLSDLQDASVKGQKTLSFLKDVSFSLNGVAFAAPALSLLHTATDSGTSPLVILATLAIGATAQFASGIFNKYHLCKYQQHSEEILTEQAETAAQKAQAAAKKLGSQIAEVSCIDTNLMGQLVHLKDSDTETLPITAQYEIFRAQTMLCLDAIAEKGGEKTKLYQETLPKVMKERFSADITTKDVEEMKSLRSGASCQGQSFAFASTHPDLNAVYKYHEQRRETAIKHSFKSAPISTHGVAASFPTLLATGIAAAMISNPGALAFAGIVGSVNAAQNLLQNKKKVWSLMKEKPNATRHWGASLARVQARNARLTR